MSNVQKVVRARIQAQRAAAAQPTEPGLGNVTLEPAAVEPVKTKAELQDELTAAGVEFPTKATKAELEALLS